MFTNGYFIGGAGASSTTGSSSKVDIIDGEVVYKASDDIYIDDNDNVFMNTEKSNAIIRYVNGEIYVEKVV